jgi:hypothetical protein
MIGFEGDRPPPSRIKLFQTAFKGAREPGDLPPCPATITSVR